MAMTIGGAMYDGKYSEFSLNLPSAKVSVGTSVSRAKFPSYFADDSPAAAVLRLLSPHQEVDSPQLMKMNELAKMITLVNSAENLTRDEAETLLGHIGSSYVKQYLDAVISKTFMVGN